MLVPRLGGLPVDLTGQGKVVEVYPALALEKWSLERRGDKRSTGAARSWLRDSTRAAPALTAR
jgi:hypothetical protein